VEADWEVEIGPGAPIIDARWDGFVDLRRAPQLARNLPEVENLPTLEGALVRLNSAQSPVWTAKCDVWQLTERDAIDPYEMAAPPESALHGWGCYIDLLPRSDQQWIVPEMAVSTCKYLCGVLHEIPQPCCRADLVIRRAMIAPAHTNLGITAYLTACGPTKPEANGILQMALGRLVDAVCGHSAIE